MKAFVSWSGGKDSLFALYSFLKDPRSEVVSLVHFCDASQLRSRSHGLSADLIFAQSQALSLPIIQEPLTADYETHLKSVILRLKAQGVEAGIFGDIYLQEHRDWLERVCAEMGIFALFPLWGRDTNELLADFVASGFRTWIVSVRTEPRLLALLGKELTAETVEYLSSFPDIDPCGENGEYHTFVFDAPIFLHPIPFEQGAVYTEGNQSFCALTLQISSNHE